MSDKNLNIDYLSRLYFVAKNYVIQKGYSSEIDWQDNLNFNSLTQKVFLKEYSWVVLASGLSDNVVSKVFPKIQKILRNWHSLDYIFRNSVDLEIQLLKVFKNKQKIKALLQTSLLIFSTGFVKFKNHISKNGIAFLKSLPFIGDVTCFHLAKNIGLPFAKPDRHLVRISEQIGFETPHQLCETISVYLVEKIQVVDLVLWRYATLDKNYTTKLEKLKANMSIYTKSN